MKFCPIKKEKGFTLIELLVVIGILAILLSIVLIAINPARQFAQANNTKRRSDTTAILNAISQYSADHKGLLPADIPDSTVGPENISSAGANICSDVMSNYISALPSDPQAANGGAAITDCSSTYDSEYNVIKDASNRVTVSAPNHVELSDSISITR